MRIYHHNDLDGRCAAAIVFHSSHGDGARSAGELIEFVEMEYDRTIDVEEIQPDGLVFVVDFSFPPEIMEQILARTERVIWIDHHKTAMDYVYSKELAGIREVGLSGCELTWIYCHGQNFPKAVKFIGDRDIWAWRFGEQTAQFCEGMKLWNTDPKSALWDRLLVYDSEATEDLIERILEGGRICIQYRDSICDFYAENYGFECRFDGRRCFALGLYMFGSEAFGEARMSEYEICISFEFTGTAYIVGLYSETVDVGALAVQCGGGGHTKAAGFTCETLPFREIYKPYDSRGESDV